MKKMFKMLITLAICLVPLVANADAGTAKFYFKCDATTITAGESTKCYLYMDSSDGITVFHTTLDFPEEKLSLVGTPTAEDIADKKFPADASSDPKELEFVGSLVTGNNVKMFSFTIKASDTATASTARLTMANFTSDDICGENTYSSGAADCEDITATIVPLDITITEKSTTTTADNTNTTDASKENPETGASILGVVGTSILLLSLAAIVLFKTNKKVI